MKKSLLNKCFLWLVLIAFYTTAYAQNKFGYKATLGNVQQSGLYSIHLPPGIVGKSGESMADIRIKSDAGKEAPYVLQQQNAAINNTAFLPFPIIKKSSNDKSIVVQNAATGNINNLLLFIRNNETNRLATLSGSDDSVHWFVIKENIVLQDYDNSSSDAFVQSLSFPPSSYKYLQVSILGKDLLPVNIVKAGIYQSLTATNVLYDNLPTPQIIQKDSSDKYSYVWINFDAAYKIEKLSFSLSGQKFFHRFFELYDNGTGRQLLASGEAASTEALQVILPRKKTGRLLLIFNNQDNSPLLVNNVAAYQLPVSLIAYLEAGGHYSLFFADSTLAAPAYDLQYFTDSLQSNSQPLAIIKVEKLAITTVHSSAQNHVAPWMLWSIIAAVLLLLIFFSYKLVKDINQKNNTNVHL